jgi:hypothetical protein
MLKIKEKIESISALKLAVINKKYRENPVFFTEHRLGHFTWNKMREIMLSVAYNIKTAVRACHGSSKTFAAADIANWFFEVYPDSKVITTAPGGRQVKDLLWAEIGKNYRTSRYALTGDCGLVGVRTELTEHYIVGFATDTASSAEGYHAPQILWILDEAKGLPPWLWDSVEGSISGGFARVLAISTTDGVNPGEMYHKIFTEPREMKNWNHIHISSKDLPLMTGEKFRGIEIPDLSRPDVFHYVYKDAKDFKIQMTGPEWVKSRADTWGKESVLYITKVLGEICDKGFNNIISLADVIKMFDNFQDKEFNGEGETEIGVDVARLGDDSTVMYKRKGLKVIGRRDFQKQRTNVIADNVMDLAITKDADGRDISKEIRIKIDDTGVGGGVTDILLEQGYNVVPVNFGADAVNKDKYINTISEAWFEISEILSQIAAPDNDRLKTELVNRKAARLDKKGRRGVESKDDYKKRGFQSPDDADAFLLCFYAGRPEPRIRG